VAKAWAVWLHYGLGLSFAKCAQLLARLGIEVTAGALSQAAQRTGTDLVPVHNEIVERANGAEMVVMDETGWRVGGNSAWLSPPTTRSPSTTWPTAAASPKPSTSSTPTTPAPSSATAGRPTAAMSTPPTRAA
jgi:hypothetical protein